MTVFISCSWTSKGGKLMTNKEVMVAKFEFAGTVVLAIKEVIIALYGQK